MKRWLFALRKHQTMNQGKKIFAQLTGFYLPSYLTENLPIRRAINT